MQNIDFLKIKNLLRSHETRCIEIYTLKNRLAFLKVIKNSLSFVIDFSKVICNVLDEKDTRPIIEIVDDPNIVTYDVDFNSVWITEDFICYGDMNRFYKIVLDGSEDDIDHTVDDAIVHTIVKANDDIVDTITVEKNLLESTNKNVQIPEPYPLDAIYVDDNAIEESNRVKIEYNDFKEGSVVSEDGESDLVDSGSVLSEFNSDIELNSNIKDSINTLVYSRPFPVLDIFDYYKMIKSDALPDWLDGIERSVKVGMDDFTRSQMDNIKESCKLVADHINKNIERLNTRIRDLEHQRINATLVKSKGMDLIIDIMDRVKTCKNVKDVKDVITIEKYGNNGPVLKEIISLSDATIEEIDTSIEDARNQLLTYVYDSSMMMSRLLQ